MAKNFYEEMKSFYMKMFIITLRGGMLFRRWP